MDLDQLKQILDLVREHELSEFEIEHDGLRLKVRKDANGSHVVTLPAPPAPLALPPAGEPVRDGAGTGRAGDGASDGGRRGRRRGRGDRAGGRQVADRRHVLPVARAGRRLVRRHRLDGEEGRRCSASSKR